MSSDENKYFAWLEIGDFHIRDLYNSVRGRNNDDCLLNNEILSKEGSGGLGVNK